MFLVLRGKVYIENVKEEAKKPAAKVDMAAGMLAKLGKSLSPQRVETSAEKSCEENSCSYSSDDDEGESSEMSDEEFEHEMRKWFKDTQTKTTVKKNPKATRLRQSTLILSPPMTQTGAESPGASELVK